jgi:hypothetical protein
LSVFHAREGFVDDKEGEGEGKRRHLVRLWLRDEVSTLSLSYAVCLHCTVLYCTCEQNRTSATKWNEHLLTIYA